MKEVLDWIDAHRAQATAFLREIVELESPTEDKAAVDAVGAVFRDAYRDLGFTVRTDPQERYGDHVIADSPAEAGPQVLLVGHMDTVYPRGTIRNRPFRIADGRAHGPAVMDMKGGLTVMLFALRAIAHHGRFGRARVVLNSDEEPGSPTSRDRWATWGEGAHCAFVLEPAQADGALVARRKGVGIFTVAVTGRAAHAGAEPEKGANAILAMARRIIDASALASPETGTTVNVGVIRGGVLPYVVPAEAVAVVDIRVPTLAERDRVLAGLRSLEGRDEAFRTETAVSGSFHRPPMEPVRGTAELQALVEGCARDVGISVRFGASGGASDGNNLAAAGIPTLDGMGPAGAGAHSETEWADLETLVQKTKLLALVLSRLWAGAWRRPAFGGD